MGGHPDASIISKSIGMRLKNLCIKNYKTKSDCARELGMTPQNWSRIEAGRVKFDPDEIFKYAAFFGVDPGWLLTGRGDGEKIIENKVDGSDNTLYVTALDRLSAPPDSRRMKVRRRENVHWWESDIQQWEVRGTGAATAALGTAGDELGYAVDMVEPPAGLTLVEAKGNSMSPVIMDGQYAMVDATREGFEVNGGIYVLVTISADGEPTVRIKRCYRIDDEYECCSIDSKNHPAFRAKISNSRVWPVIGVWFAGKGRPPRRG